MGIWYKRSKRQNITVIAAVYAVAICIGLAGTQAVAKADVNDFAVTNFSANYYLSNKDPQGEMRSVEKIDVNFSDQNHGIERAIPKSYNGKSVKVHINSVSSDSGAPAQYKTSDSNGNLVVRIGNPDRTVTGPQSYTVDYTIDNVINFSGQEPQLYWDINGTDWAQSFDTVKATIHLENGLQLSGDRAAHLRCLTGSQGDNGQECAIQADGSMVMATTNAALAPHQTLTVVAGFKGGYFHTQTFSDSVADYWRPVVSVLALPVIATAYGYGRWRKHGRDPKGRGTVVAQYDAPDGLSPIEVGTIDNFTVDNRDLTAGIINLAIRKYIKIIEHRKDKLIGKDKLTYELELLRTDFAGLDADETVLINALFSKLTPGERMELNSAGVDLYKAARTIRGDAQSRLTAAGYFAANPGKAGVSLLWGLLAMFVVAFVLAWLLTPLAFLGLVLAAGISFFFMSIMPARSAKGVTALEHMQGLKLYLQVAEAERIKKLDAPNAAYADNRGAPQRTVELFEKLLPFAIVFGVENEWAKQFEGLYQASPGWFDGGYSPGNAFSAGFLVGSLNNGFQTAVTSSFAPPNSSSSSGFGGGGFSGGGGGGGGGGGW